MNYADTQLVAGKFIEVCEVWRIEGNKVSSREVTVYSPTGEANLLISKGLEPGETVVTAGVYQLTEGEKVKIDN